MALGYVTAIYYGLVFANAGWLLVVSWEGHSYSRVHLIGQKCVVQDESSIAYFWFIFPKEKHCTF